MQETIMHHKASFPEMKGLSYGITIDGITNEPTGLALKWECPVCNSTEKFICVHRFEFNDVESLDN